MPIIQVSKTVSAPLALEIVDAICDDNGYQANIPNPDEGVEFLDPPTNSVPNPTFGQSTIPNPETDQDFAQRMLDERFVEYGRNVLNKYREKQATVGVTKVNNSDFT